VSDVKTSEWIGIIIAILILAVSYWAIGIIGAIYGGVVGTLVYFLIFIIMNYDKAMKISSHFLKTLSTFNWFERRTVSNLIQGTINEYSARLNSEANGLLPYGIQIKWVDPSKVDRDSFVKQGQVIVHLESHVNEARNLSRATWLYVQESLIPDSRKYVHGTIMRASDFTVVRKILTLERRNDALRYFNEEFVRPEVEKDAEIEKYINSLRDIDAQGFFTRILLREFLGLGPKLFPSVSDLVSERETKELTDVLTRLARKKKGVDVSPTYEGKIIRVSVMPIARAEVDDVSPHVKFARSCVKDQIPNLYVVAREAVNISLARMVVKEVESLRLFEKISEQEFDILGEMRTPVKAYVAILTRKG